MDETLEYKDFGFAKPPQPYWIASTPSTDYPRLDNDIKVDAAIIGGGIAGITTAYLLKKEGLKVAVIEADRIAHGTTGHTTAKLTSQHELIYGKLIKHLGKEKAQQYADANESAINFIEQLIRTKNIDCDFSRQPAYIYTQSDQYVQKIQDEVTAAASLGIKADYTEQIPLPFEVKAAERFADQAQFHPRKYVLSLAKDIPGDCSFIFEQSRVVDLQQGQPCTVFVKGGHKVVAEQVIIASHYPFYDSNGLYFTRMYPERSYVLGVKINEKFAGGMYITAEDPGRSLRATPWKDSELLIISGESHRPGEGKNTNIHYENLIKFAKETYNVSDIPFRWSTQDYTTLDDVPYVGRITASIPNIYVATGFRKWGMTNSTASAIILKDLIVKGESPWAPVYNPSRFEADPMFSNFLDTNIQVAKHFIGDRLKPMPQDDDVNPGEATVAQNDGTKVGIYKDEKGKIHAVDRVCTHMGCNLIWNAAELSWDCPCHGSRFTYDGDIIEGPALKSIGTDGDIDLND